MSTCNSPEAQIMTKVPHEVTMCLMRAQSLQPLARADRNRSAQRPLHSKRSTVPSSERAVEARRALDGGLAQRTSRASSAARAKRHATHAHTRKLDLATSDGLRASGHNKVRYKSSNVLEFDPESCTRHRLSTRHYDEHTYMC